MAFIGGIQGRLVTLLAALAFVPATAAAQSDVPVTGRVVPALSAFDDAMVDTFDDYSGDVPGGAVAVVRDGRLVYQRGFGFSDVAREQAMAPGAKFRIASVTKPLSAIAAGRLAQAGAFSFDTPVTSILPDLAPAGGGDPRLDAITPGLLVLHRAGWDIGAIGFDPTQKEVVAARETGAAVPGDCPTVARWWARQPLNFDPGARYAYSNLGFCVLGMTIERVMGAEYHDAMRALVLDPLGMSNTLAAHSLPEQRLAGEVEYSDYEDAPLVSSKFAPFGKVPGPYGGYNIDGRGAIGSWVSTTRDLALFTATMSGARPSPFVVPPVPTSPEYGPVPVPAGPGKNWMHSGSQVGTASMIRQYGRTQYAVLFNGRPRSVTFYKTFLKRLDAAARATSSWPRSNGFRSVSPTP